MFADLVLVNGQVITSNMEYDVNEAVAVTDNQIVMVGKNEEVKRLIGSQTEVVDLAGRSLVPGFIDSHLHITLFGTNKLGVSCKEANIQSLHDVLKEIEKKVNETPIGNWVRAWGSNETKISENRYPSRKELDLISSNHPILIRRACGHISVVNSKALEIADLVVLNGAILDVPTDQIKDMQVDYTIIVGKVVFQKESNDILSKS